MPQYLKSALSTGSSPVQITQTSSPGNLLHQVGNYANSLDEVWLIGSNTTNVPILVTVEFGGVDISDRIIQVVPSNKSVTLVQGLPITGGRSVRVYAESSGVNVAGWKYERIVIDDSSSSSS